VRPKQNDYTSPRRQRFLDRQRRRAADQTSIFLTDEAVKDLLRAQQEVAACVTRT
jgi:hypothetical protein